MKLYETVFVVNPEIPLKDAQEISEKYQELIKNNSGEVTEAQAWGKLKLAYEVKGFKEGLYFMVRFNSTPELLPELEQKYKYDENVIRHAIVHVDGKKFRLKKKKKENKERSGKSTPESGKEETAQQNSQVSEEQNNENSS